MGLPGSWAPGANALSGSKTQRSGQRPESAVPAVLCHTSVQDALDPATPAMCIQPGSALPSPMGTHRVSLPAVQSAAHTELTANVFVYSAGIVVLLY